MIHQLLLRPQIVKQEEELILFKCQTKRFSFNAPVTLAHTLQSLSHVNPAQGLFNYRVHLDGLLTRIVVIALILKMPA